jgi:signal transduction histidine kinase
VRRWSIRARLTAWFAGVLGVVLVALVAAVWWALADTVGDTIDASLAARVDAVARFLNQPGTSQAVEELRDDLREYVALDAGWSLLRIRDETGAQVYRSDAFEASGAPRDDPAAPGGRRFSDAVMRGRAVRLLAARAMVRGEPYRIDVAVPTSEWSEVLSEFRAIVLLVIPLGIVAAALGGYWISGRALAPVDRITSTARSITAEHLTGRLDVPDSGDELQRLSETLNAMLDRLGASFEEVRRFTADASHELRTPVSIVRTTAEVALRQPRPAEEYRAALESVLQEAERASTLVEDLLLLARADAGVDQAAREVVDVRAIVAGLQARIAAHAAAYGLTATVETAAAPAVVVADRAALTRLIWILVDNAVKYTPSPGAIGITLALVPDPDVQPLGSGTKPGSGANVEGTAAVTLTVRDTGIGIAREDLPRVFDRFYRTDPARSRESGGAGLGLSIAKSIVDRHGGRIVIESEPGRGTCVRVEMRAARDPGV